MPAFWKSRPNQIHDLNAAHSGYEYQDLLVGCRLVDVLLGEVLEVRVDEKLVDDDRFDDLTTQHADGSRERVQFKHTDSDDRPLTAATFTYKNDFRRLRLDKVFASMIADRDGPGHGANRLMYRIVLRDAPPIDPQLVAVLCPAANDPGPFLPALQTARLAFDADALWAQMGQLPADVSDSGGLFAFLGSGDMPLTYPDLVWACSHLFVEVSAPAASSDLISPDAAEAVLLRRVREEVGAGLYPNRGRDAIDVAEAMIRTARMARQGSHVVTRDEILFRAQLRTDFGAVAREHPVDRSVQVSRTSSAQQIMASAAELAQTGGTLLLVGPPGQGKSWLCQQVLEELSDLGWLVAEHYCYLGEADTERTERVLADRVFGSLICRMADADPRVIEGKRPSSPRTKTPSLAA